MSRQQSDREDLLAEATALVERVELEMAFSPDPVVIGFRRNDAGCIYCGAEPVFQFNPAGQLRRAYVDGQMLIADSGRLLQVERQNVAGSLQLSRTELPAQRQAAINQLATQVLEQSLSALAADEFRILRQVPPELDILARIVDWLRQLPQPLQIAERPHAAG